MAGTKQEAFKRLEEVFEAGRDADEERAESVRLLIAVDHEAPHDLVACLKDAFMPVCAGAIIEVRLAGDVAMDPSGTWDACVVIAGGSDDIVEHAAVGIGRRGSPVVIVAQSVLDIPESCLTEPISAFVSTIAASDARSLKSQLAKWILKSSSKSTAFAASFPFCRKGRVRELTRACAAQNAAIGVINLLPGADMPYITVNQAKLALDIAAVYGLPFSFARAPELAGVVAAGFGYRGIARLAVGLIPGIGRVLRGVMAYVGTLSTSRALVAHFALEESDEDDPIEAMREEMVETIDSLRGALPAFVDSIAGWPSRDEGRETYVERPAAEDYIVYTGAGSGA